MGCMLVLALFGLPRIALIWIWLTRNGYVQDEAFGGNMLFSALGFLFLPTTTLSFVCLRHYAGTVVLDNFANLAVLVVGLLLDTGGWSGGRQQLSKRRE